MAGSITIFGTDLFLTDGGEGEPILIGEESRAFAGNQRNSVRGERRTFSGVTSPVLEATWDTVKAAVARRAQGAVSGPALSNNSYTASVRASGKAVPGLPGFFVISLAGEEV